MNKKLIVVSVRNSYPSLSFDWVIGCEEEFLKFLAQQCFPAEATACWNDLDDSWIFRLQRMMNDNEEEIEFALKLV